jgi:hypothetical protein
LPATKYDEFAADRGHSEAKLNDARCLRLPGLWEPPDRSSDFVAKCPSPAPLTELLREFREKPGQLDSDGFHFLDSLK